MYSVDNEKKEINVFIPLTKHTGKIRVKERRNLNEYGIPFSTRQHNISLSLYIEWQIGYDVITSDIKKSEEAKYKDKTFTGANGKEKYLFELSEYIKCFYVWDIINEQELLSIKQYLTDLPQEDYFDNHNDLGIKRSDLAEKEINGITFDYTTLKYPLIIYKFNNSQIVAEIGIKEKQYAVGTQPMLYLCFPFSELKDGQSYYGRTANEKENAIFVINESKKTILLEMLKLFGMLSKNHHDDVISIIDLILN